MRPAVAGSPHADAVGIDLGLSLEPGDGVADVVDLLERHDAPLRPFAAAESAVIEGQRDVAGFGEELRVVREDRLANPAVAVAQHDAGPALAAFQARGDEVVAFEP